MSVSRCRIGALAALALSSPLLVQAGSADADPDQIPGVEADGGPIGRVDVERVSIWRVFVDGPEDSAALSATGVDLLEGAGDGYLFVIGENGVADELRSSGFRVELDRRLGALDGVGADTHGKPGDVSTQTFFGGYRTVDEHVEHLDDVAAEFPRLATLYDYGDSWRKTQGRSGPNDLLAICLTNKQPGDCALNPDSSKPRAVVQAAIHARELQTAEVAWRLIDELTQNYGSDADITHILDTTEVWIIPVVNPDGRQIVESGGNRPFLQRKNANDSAGSCSSPPSSGNQFGVDLNRNATFGWGGIGTSTNPCSAVYRGTSPGSEPEEASLETLFTQLWPDLKGARDSPAPTSTTGTFITLHSFGNLVLLPPGVGGTSPNDAQLRALAFRMSHFNGYRTGTGPEILYGTTGTTDDHVYYTLGVPGFTYELSPSSGPCSGFTPAYSCVDSSIWPTNRDALLYSLKVAGAPYVTPRGPTTTSVTDPGSASQGSPLPVSATVNDDAFGLAPGSFGRPSAQPVDAAEYSIDVPFASGGAGSPMAAADGAFDSAAETVRADVDTTGLAVGEHTVYVRASNTAGFWGPVTAADFTVTTAGPTDPGPATGPVFVDDFESDLGWQTNPNGTDTATTGQWERGDPQPTDSRGPKQLGDTTSGSNALVTGAAAGSSVGVFDVDTGVTSVRSPAITLPADVDVTLSFDHYLANTSNSSTADFLQVSVVGSTESVVLSVRVSKRT